MAPGPATTSDSNPAVLPTSGVAGAPSQPRRAARPRPAARPARTALRFRPGRTAPPSHRSPFSFTPSPSPRARRRRRKGLLRPPSASCDRIDGMAGVDASSPSALVNGETLNMFVGRRVRTVVQVQRNEGGIVVGQSTDGHQLTIKGVSDPIHAPNFMEVVGIAEGNQAIRAEVCTDFGVNFDPKVFDELCKLSNDKFKHMFL
ncbi:hypothetical protein EJB05_32115, partial [Eragrostis curvula]